MKKIFLTLAYVSIFTSPIFSMKRQTKITEYIKPASIVPVPTLFPDELKACILLDLSKNVHNYIHKNNPSLAPRIILTISSINKDLYNQLDKERNDPITTREIVQKLGTICHPHFTEGDIIRTFKTSGAKKCIMLSDQLYDYHKDKHIIENLIHNGALLNYNKKDRLNVLQCISLSCVCDRGSQSMKELLKSGANPNIAANNTYTPLGLAIKEVNINKIKIILEYKPIDKCWKIALEKNDMYIINLLIENSTPDELNNGLLCCINHQHYIPDIMQTFIDNGAKPHIVLNNIPSQHSYKSNLQFLRNQKAKKTYSS